MGAFSAFPLRIHYVAVFCIGIEGLWLCKEIKGCEFGACLLQ